MASSAVRVQQMLFHSLMLAATRLPTSLEKRRPLPGDALDVMPAAPGATDAFVVAAVDSPRDLVLTVPDGRGGSAVAWEHLLDPLPGGGSRLFVRGRASSQWGPLGLWERINISVFLIWVVVLAAYLCRPVPAQGETL